MVLGVNGIRLIGKRTGVGRVIEAILKCMDGLDHPFTEIRVYTPSRLDAEVQLPALAKNVVLPSGLPPALWEQYVLPRGHGRRDLLLCPSYVAPILSRCPILLIHHGSYEGYPQGFAWWPRTKARLAYTVSAWRADRIATVTERSKADIVRFYRVDRRKIEVIPAGVDTELFRPIPDGARLSAWRKAVLAEDVPFLLYVGKLTKRRNLPSLIEAFADLKQRRGMPHRLVLMGIDLDRSPLRATVREFGVESEVVAVAFASHEEIALAYNAAAMLVYPSSYEGFGLPVLEAMACGTPAIALANTSFQEFADGVALLLPDARVETLKAGIEQVLDDAALRERMARLGPQRAAAYDWYGITARYVDLMCEVAGLPRAEVHKP